MPWALRSIDAALPAVVAALWVAGCAMDEAELGESASVDLVGMTEEALRSCAGTPTHEAQVATGRALTYVLRMRRSFDAGPPPQYGLAGARMRSADSALPPEPERPMACEATMLIRDGKVASVDFSAVGGPMLCERILRRCAAG